MSNNYIDLGTGTTNAIIYFPAGYDFAPVNLETHERTLDGSMITNYYVTTGANRVIKRNWNISGIRVFTTDFRGATGTTCSVYCLGANYSARIMTQNYKVLNKTSTGNNIIQYSISVEEI
ncbi:MAG: hypothetical protein V1709_06200 [Planctomycetota bacterium]